MTIEQINILCEKVPEKYRMDVKSLLSFYLVNNVDGVFEEAMNLIAYNIERYQSKGYLPLLNQYCSRLSYIWKNLLTDWSEIIPAKYLANMLDIMQDYTERGHTVELKTMQKQLKEYKEAERTEELDCYCNHMVNLWDINLEIETIKLEIAEAKEEKETLVTEEEMRKLFWELTSVQTSVLTGGIHSYGDLVLMKENMIEFREDLRTFRNDIVEKGITPQVINTLLRIVKKGGLVESVEDGLDDSFAHLGCVRVTTNDATDKEEFTTKHVKVSGLGNFTLLPYNKDNIIDALNAVNSGVLHGVVCSLDEYQLGEKREDTFYFITGSDPQLYKGATKVWGTFVYNLVFEQFISYKESTSTGKENDVILVNQVSEPVLKNNGNIIDRSDYELTYYLKDNPSFASINLEEGGLYRAVTFTRNETGANDRQVTIIAKATYQGNSVEKVVGTVKQSRGNLYEQVINDWSYINLTCTNPTAFIGVAAAGSTIAALFKTKEERKIDLVWNLQDTDHPTKYTGSLVNAGTQKEYREKQLSDYTLINGSVPSAYASKITISTNQVTIAANSEVTTAKMKVSFEMVSNPLVSTDIDIEQTAADVIYYYGSNVDEVPTTIPTGAEDTTNSTWEVKGSGHKCMYVYIPTSILDTKQVSFMQSGLPLELENMVVESGGTQYRLYYHCQREYPLIETDIIIVKITNK